MDLGISYSRLRYWMRLDDVPGERWLGLLLRSHRRVEPAS
jgi:hypothetical protein